MSESIEPIPLGMEHVSLIIIYSTYSFKNTDAAFHKTKHCCLQISVVALFGIRAKTDKIIGNIV